MASLLTQLRVFLATPGGLTTERQVFREEVSRFNENHGHDMGFVLVPVGWEQVPAGAGRSQELINAEVRAADYLVALIWDRWGTATSVDLKYSSGTQEELIVALECLGDETAAMRNVAVFFKAVDEQRLSDPGRQLAAVIQFKQHLETTKELHFRTIDTVDEWQNQLQRLFMSWIRAFGDNTPKKVAIRKSTADWLAQQSGGGSSVPASELLVSARELELQGLMTQAESAYAVAVSIGDCNSLISYAKFLRRTGRLEKAFQINSRVLDLKTLHVDRSKDSVSDRSDLLANMGLIRRKQGDLNDSLRLLNEAVKTARMCPGSQAVESEAYALDNRGLTFRRLGKHDAALENHEAALSLRKQLGNGPSVANTLINISRLRRDQGDIRVSRELATEAVEILQELDGEHRALANAYSTLGEIALAAGDLEPAREYFEKSLYLNEEFLHVDGIAIVSGQLAQLFVARGEADNALPYAERCLEENSRSGNHEGVAIALRTLGDVKSAMRYLTDAKAHYQDAFEMFRSHQNTAGAVSAQLCLADVLLREGLLDLSKEAADKANSLSQGATVSATAVDRIARLRGEATP